MWATNLKILTVTAAVLAFYTMVAHIIPQLESEVPEDLDLSAAASPEALAAAGQRIFEGAGGCTACHGLGTRAPNLLTDHGGRGPIGQRCEAAFGSDCKTYLFTSLTQPGDSVLPGFENIMPDLRRQLSEDQVWATVAYLQSLGGTVTVTADDVATAAAGTGAPPPAGTPAPSTTTDPRELLVQNACLGCHAIDGVGPPIGPPFDAIGQRLTTDQIRDGILRPNADTAQGYEQFAGLMPTTFGQTLTAEQLEAMVRFLAGRR